MKINLRYIFHSIVIFILIYMMISCNPLNYAIRKHDRLVERFPTIHKRDTVLIKDTVRITIPEVRVDTVFHINQLIDTITLIKEHLKVKIYRTGDSIYVDGKSEPIYIEKIVERKIPVVYYPEDKNTWGWLKWIIVGLFALAILYIVLNRKKKKDEYSS